MTTNNNKSTTTGQKPKLILKNISNPTPIISSTSMIFSSSPIATGSFYLPMQKNNRKGGRYPPPPKHLRKPPSFDTYVHSSSFGTSQTIRTPSLSSSYSSTTSLTDNVLEYNEDMMCGYGVPKSAAHARLRRGSAPPYRVRFADTGDDGSSIVSCSSSSIDEWDETEIDDDDDEDYIFVPRYPPRHYYNYHKKSGST